MDGRSHRHQQAEDRRHRSSPMRVRDFGG